MPSGVSTEDPGDGFRWSTVRVLQHRYQQLLWFLCILAVITDCQARWVFFSGKTSNRADASGDLGRSFRAF